MKHLHRVIAAIEVSTGYSLTALALCFGILAIAAYCVERIRNHYHRDYIRRWRNDK